MLVNDEKSHKTCMFCICPLLSRLQTLSESSSETYDQYYQMLVDTSTSAGVTYDVDLPLDAVAVGIP